MLSHSLNGIQQLIFSELRMKKMWFLIGYPVMFNRLHVHLQTLKRTVWTFLIKSFKNVAHSIRPSNYRFSFKRACPQSFHVNKKTKSLFLPEKYFLRKRLWRVKGLNEYSTEKYKVGFCISTQRVIVTPDRENQRWHFNTSQSRR